jgi:periplasmic divalent cation tolerance protein
MDEFIVVFSTASSAEEAESIAGRLVDEKLAACVSIVPTVKSIYVWEGKVCRDEESLMVIKSARELQEKLVDRINDLHSYDCPEVIVLPITGGSEMYLQWLGESVGGEI